MHVLNDKKQRFSKYQCFRFPLEPPSAHERQMPPKQHQGPQYQLQFSSSIERQPLIMCFLHLTHQQI